MATYPFNNNIPQAGDLVSDSQPLLLQNNGSIASIIGVNHYSFGSASANDGKHMFVSLPVQAADPSTAAQELAIYSKLDANNVTQLFFIQPSDGTAFQFTPMGATTASTATSTGYAILPGRLVMKWGYQAGVGAGTAVTLNNGVGPNVVQVLNAQVCIAQQTATAIASVAIGTTGITLYSSVTNRPVLWSAVAIF